MLAEQVYCGSVTVGVFFFLGETLLGIPSNLTSKVYEVADRRKHSKFINRRKCDIFTSPDP